MSPIQLLLANHGWLVVSTHLKNISQLGWLFPIYGKLSKPPTKWYLINYLLYACCRSYYLLYWKRTLHQQKNNGLSFFWPVSSSSTSGISTLLSIQVWGKHREATQFHKPSPPLNCDPACPCSHTTTSHGPTAPEGTIHLDTSRLLWKLGSLGVGQTPSFSLGQKQK